MKFSARVQNSPGIHATLVRAGEKELTLDIPPKPNGGSSVSGGELLMLALATCYCNDIYREAGKRNIIVEHVEVEVDCDFEAEGKSATNVRYRARVKAKASEAEVLELIKQTDAVAEIQNTLRAPIPVVLEL